jgi:NADH:ubiquinone oxidoreductase subunit E
VSFAEKKLGIECGETTADGMFTLSEEECLGACTTAPAMMANEDYVEDLDINKLNAYIEKVKHER